MTDLPLSRRTLLAGAAVASLTLLPGCAGVGDGFNLAEAIRRLLTISSQRAFARLLQDGGFYDSQATRIEVPAALGGNGMSGAVGALLASAPVKEQLLKTLNRAAERGAKRAAPMVTQAIGGLSIPDALSIVRGGPTAATDLLQQSMGEALVTAMFPEIGEGLRVAGDPLIGRLLAAATGIDANGLARNVSQAASDGIYRAIGAEEAAIRRDPSSARDSLILGVFSIL